jgi:hypothetical protein
VIFLLLNLFLLPVLNFIGPPQPDYGKVQYFSPGPDVTITDYTKVCPDTWELQTADGGRTYNCIKRCGTLITCL